MPEIKLYNDDCIAAMKKVADKSIDLIVTDPPYNLGNYMKNRDTNLSKMRDNFFGSAGWDDMEFDEWEKSMDDFFKSAAKVMKKGGTMVVFMAIIKVETIIRLAEKHASCTVTCADCPFSDYCKSEYRVKNGVGCKRKCDCCSSYVRRTLELDKPLGFNDDGTEFTFDIADEGTSVENTHSGNEQTDLIAAVIASFDPVDRELWSYLVQKIKKAEIADRLHMSVDGVYYRQKRLERLLRENETLKKYFNNF